uniref:procollagen-lysine 5-dioxygenase n=1 Tax=Parascaris univalens TaxID=6257 RepID=A0A915AZB8_PARUN
MWRNIVVALSLSFFIQPPDVDAATSLHVVTVASEHHDALERLQRSASAHEIRLNILRLDQSASSSHLGGGEELRILRDGLEMYKDRNDLILLYVDAKRAIINGREEEIVKKFMDSYGTSEIVFSSDNYCFPDEQLEQRYPTVEKGKRFLNSAAFIGYANKIWELLNSQSLENISDEQLFYTHLFLDEQLRSRLQMVLDSTSQIFHSVDVSKDEITLDFSDNGDAYITNVIHKTHPLIIHGDESNKLMLNYLGNYIGNAWSADFGCRDCSAQQISFLKDDAEQEWPKLTLAIVLAKPIPFVEEFLTKVEKLEYPKSNIDLYLYSNQKYNEREVNEFLRKARGKYSSVEWDSGEVEIGEREARRTAIDMAIKANNDFVFLLDANVHFVDPNVIRWIIESALTMNLGILAPMVGKPNKFFTNFWGAISSSGYYERSEDYTEIVNYKRVGVWNVPFISSSILINKQKMREIRDGFFYNADVDADLSFCQFARDNDHFLYVDNQRYYGFLADSETFDNSGKHLHPEMYQIFENRYLWESRYVHPDYFAALDGSAEIAQPCPDVYDYPLMSEKFAKELIEEMENFGHWSDGKNEDERLAGGYENVPTIDIHMNQIDFQREWLYFLDEYVRPMQEKLFIGYYQKPVEALMMFVVRYKPGEQPSLRAHHDASTYTIDVPLNKRGRDYEGGGVRYVRYNCTVDADQVGYAAMFPGRLTHLHEGLPVTKGTRYIAVSFLNP